MSFRPLHLKLLALSWLSSACAALSPTPSTSAVGVYHSSERGFKTASYWIEGPQGMVLVDTQFLISAGVEAVKSAEAATGKKVVAAIVLHPNPDKFNGATTLQKMGIKVLSSQQVIDLIPEVHRDRHYWFYERYKPDYPKLAPKLNSLGTQTTVIELAGLRIKAHIFGPAASGAHVVLEYQGHLFVGDMIASQGHPWLELGLLEEWKGQLHRLRELKPRYIHPGRGPAGGPELIEKQLSYLLRVEELLAEVKLPESASKETLEAAFSRIKTTLVKEHPNYSNPYFIEIGLPEVYKHWKKRKSVD